MSDPLVAWVIDQQAVAEASVERNKTAVLVRGCTRCGRTDTEVSYRFGLANQPVCRDYGGCDRRRVALWSDTATLAEMLR